MGLRFLLVEVDQISWFSRSSFCKGIVCNLKSKVIKKEIRYDQQGSKDGQQDMVGDKSRSNETKSEQRISV